VHYVLADDHRIELTCGSGQQQDSVDAAIASVQAADASEVHLVIMIGRRNDFHPFGEHRAEAGAGLEAGIPALGLFVPAPVDGASPQSLMQPCA
jgi:hypothetical protein